MSKKKSPKANYTDAVFVFPEGQFKINTRNERPSQSDTNRQEMIADEIEELLKMSLRLLKESNETPTDIVEFIIDDFTALKKKIEDLD